MKNKFWNFVLHDEENAELILDGEIASEESWFTDVITPKEFTKELKNLGNVSHITVRINSSGGDVFAANAIYCRLKDHKAKITIKIDGWAASAATIICMAGDEIYIPRNGIYMIHNPMAMLFGYYDVKKLEKLKAELQVIKKGIISTYTERTGRTAEEIEQLMDDETWWTGEEAVENGFCDGILFNDAEYSFENDGRRCFVNKISMNIADYNIPNKIKNLIKEDDKMANLEKDKIVSVEQLRSEFPELIKEIEEKAVAAEHERFKAIDKLTLNGYEDLADEAKYKNPMSAADFSMKIIEMEKQKSEDYLENLEKDIKDCNVNKVSAVASPQPGEKENPYMAAIDAIYKK